MKNIFLLWSFGLFLIFIANTATVFSHPGNTDADGGHTCWTNCEKWGLEYGEYHYHNTNSDYHEESGEDFFESNTYFSEDFPNECVHLYVIGTQEEMESCYELSYQSGYDQGHIDFKLLDNHDLSYSNNYDLPSYEKGYAAGWTDSESGIANKETGNLDNDNVVDSASSLSNGSNRYETMEESNNLENLLFFILVGIGVIIFILIQIYRTRLKN